MKLTCFRNVFACFRKDVTHLRLRKHVFPSTEIWRKHKKVVWFCRKRSDGNTSKRYVSANGNMSLPSCFRNGFTGLRMFPLTDSWNFVVHGTGSNPKYSETVPNMCKVWENRRCYRSISSLFTMPCQLVLFKIVPTRTLGGSQDTLWSSKRDGNTEPVVHERGRRVQKVISRPLNSTLAFKVD